MIIHEVLLVPGAGSTDSEGRYTRGVSIPAIAEVDVVDRYVAAIVDELDNAGIRYRVMPTRGCPGVREDARHAGILANTLVLHCKVGWVESKKIRMTYNTSMVHYNALASDLGEMLSEVMREWGGLYLYGHRSAKSGTEHPDQLLRIRGAPAARLEPFLLNGPNAIEYCAKLTNLGRDIGRALCTYLERRKMAQAASINTFPDPQARTF